MAETQSTSSLIHGIREHGISLSIYEGRLKAKPKALIDGGIRESIMANRDRIIEALKGVQQENEHSPQGRDIQQKGIPPAQGLVKKSPRTSKKRPSPIALEWLKQHRQALDDSGWTRAELYRRNKSKQGLVWLRLWDEAFNRAYLHEDGTIQFECSIHGRDYFQTARLASMLVTPDSQNVNPKFRSVNND